MFAYKINSSWIPVDDADSTINLFEVPCRPIVTFAGVTGVWHKRRRSRHPSARYAVGYQKNIRTQFVHEVTAKIRHLKCQQNDEWQRLVSSFIFQLPVRV